MKYFSIALFFSISSTLYGQSNEAFRIQLSTHLEDLAIEETLEVNYQKKVCWGVYETGVLSFTLNKEQRIIVEQKTLQDGRALSQNSTGYQKDELISKLINAKDIERNDDEYAINNMVIYTFKKEDIELGIVALPLLPEEIIHPITTDVNLSDFFKKDKKSSGIIKF